MSRRSHLAVLRVITLTVGLSFSYDHTWIEDDYRDITLSNTLGS